MKSAFPARLLAPALLVFGLPAGIMAHPSGHAKIDIHLIDPDSVTFTVNVNPDDLIEATHSGIKSWSNPEKRREEAAHYEKSVTTYLLSRMRPEVNQRLVPLKVLRWKPGGKGPEDGFGDDSLGAFFTPTREILFGGVLPRPRSRMRLSVQLFQELEVQSVSRISLFWNDTLVHQAWITPDRELQIPLQPDSLQALLQSARQARAEGSSGQESGFLRFIGIGFTHILPWGLDHMLFVLGLFFFSTRIRPLAVQITAFTVAHSLTLGLSLIWVFSLPSRVVEPLIALSIAAVALENIFYRKLSAWRWLIVFGFGLVHGLGFAGALRDFGLPPGSFWPTLLGFNLGVEFGQLAVVALAFGLTRWFWNKPWYFQRISIPVSAAISSVALYWAAQRLFWPGG